MTALPVAIAAATPISCLAIVFGARTMPAAEPPVSTAPATGSPVEQPSMLMDRQVSIADLEERARPIRKRMSMRDWVRSLFAPTSRPRPYRWPPTGFVDGAIGMWELYNVAVQWDGIGRSTPTEFVRALACETEGHPRGDAVRILMPRVVDLKSESETPDEWATWRYGL